MKADPCRGGKEWYSVEVKCTQSVIRAILPENNGSKNLGILKNSQILGRKGVNVGVELGKPVKFGATCFKRLFTKLSAHPCYQNE